MGMSTHVMGIKPPDAKWKKMKAVWDACTDAGLPIPREVTEFFNWDKPEDAGVSVDEAHLKRSGAISEWSENGRSGFELHLAHLDKDITVIRFYNAW